MTGKPYVLKIITSEKIFYEGDAVSSIFPGEAGYLGVLADHAPLATPCVPGRLYVRDRAGLEYRYQIGGGFLEVLNNRVTLLVDEIPQDLPQETSPHG